MPVPKERYREWKRAWRAKNLERVRECDRIYSAAYRERHHDAVRARERKRSATEHRREYEARWRDENRDLVRERDRRRQRIRYIQAREAETKIKISDGYRANGEALLVEIRKLIPRHYDPATRDEMIGEATMLALEGATAAEAVKRAITAVNRVERPGRYSKPLEDCFWL